MSGKASKRHGFLKLLGLLLFAFLFWFGWTCLWVVRESWQQEIHPADAIVVFGAAEYSGRPSPVLRARLDHAGILVRAAVFVRSRDAIAGQCQPGCGRRRRVGTCGRICGGSHDDQSLSRTQAPVALRLPVAV